MERVGSAADEATLSWKEHHLEAAAWRGAREPPRLGRPAGRWGRLAGMAARGFPYTDLKDFLAALERAGELRRVGVPVDPTLEISEIVTRTVRAGGPAL